MNFYQLWPQVITTFLFEQSTLGTGWTKHEMAPGLMSRLVCYKNGVFQKLCIANQRNLKMPALQMNMWTGKIFENRPMGGHPLNFGKKIDDKKASREGIKNHPLPSGSGSGTGHEHKIHNVNLIPRAIYALGTRLFKCLWQCVDGAWHVLIRTLIFICQVFLGILIIFIWWLVSKVVRYRLDPSKGFRGEACKPGATTKNSQHRYRKLLLIITVRTILTFF